MNCVSVKLRLFTFIYKVSLEIRSIALLVQTQMISAPELSFFAILLQQATDPTDPLFQHQWYLKNTGQNGGKPKLDLNVAAAWAQGVTGKNVTTAIMDDGVDYMHPDLIHNYVSQSIITCISRSIQGIAKLTLHAIHGINLKPYCQMKIALQMEKSRWFVQFQFSFDYWYVIFHRGCLLGQPDFLTNVPDTFFGNPWSMYERP